MSEITHHADCYRDHHECAIAEVERLRDAITLGGFDLSPCKTCGLLVVCVPDGLAMCRDCDDLVSDMAGG